MIGEYKLEKTEDDMEDVTYPLTDLQQKIAERYTVHPVDSCRAYQVLVSDDGLHHRILHRTFIFRMEGKATPSKVRTICDALFTSVCTLFPEGALVVWRVRPTIEEKDATETCETCGQNTHEPKFFTYGRMRIGCLGAELTSTEAPYHVGYPVPTLNVTRSSDCGI